MGSLQPRGAIDVEFRFFLLPPRHIVGLWDRDLLCFNCSVGTMMAQCSRGAFFSLVVYMLMACANGYGKL